MSGQTITLPSIPAIPGLKIKNSGSGRTFIIPPGTYSFSKPVTLRKGESVTCDYHAGAGWQFFNFNWKKEPFPMRSHACNLVSLLSVVERGDSTLDNAAMRHALAWIRGYEKEASTGHVTVLRVCASCGQPSVVVKLKKHYLELLGRSSLIELDTTQYPILCKVCTHKGYYQPGIEPANMAIPKKFMLKLAEYVKKGGHK